MIALEGSAVRLRALEPEDIDALYLWENDPQVWHVSGTIAPFSRHQLERFIGEQQYDLFATRQQRLVIETLDARQAVGTLDLFEIDPLHRRAGIGILIHGTENRGKGYASDAIEVVCGYAAQTLRLHQLWCHAGAANQASLALFTKAGFTTAGIRRAWNWNGTQYEDEVMMQKIL